VSGVVSEFRNVGCQRVKKPTEGSSTAYAWLPAHAANICDLPLSRSVSSTISEFSHLRAQQVAMAQSQESHSLIGLLLQPQVLPFFLIAAIYTAIKILDRTDIPKIKNLPEIPGVPIFGNLYGLGDNHAKKAAEWSKKYGPVFQVRLGNRRIIFANTFDSVKNLWITNQSALISRPTLHTFHTIVSSSEGFTIGTSPWDESCKARRKAAATALNRPAVQSYMPIVDYECTKSIKEMLVDSNYGKKDVDPNTYFQRFALSTSLTLNYGVKIEGNVDDEMLKEITHVEREVSNFRSTANNWADYVPFLRLKPGGNTKALEYKKRRANYMYKLLNMLKKRIADGTDVPCITGNVLKDPEAKLTDGKSVKPAAHQNRPTDSSHSRNNVHRPLHGLRRPRHRPRQPNNVYRLPRLPSRPRNPSPRPRRNQLPIPQQRCLGALLARRKSPLHHCLGERDSTLLVRDPHMSATHKYQRHQVW
jgi:hypothetical protein